MVCGAQISTMKIKFNPADLKETNWYEYCLRFLFGGAITAATGMIAKKFGPVVGGLFMAFPAIFPAAASLLEDEQKEKKKREGLDGTMRGREAAGLDAVGSAMGALGLVAFAVIAWRLIDRYPPWTVLLASTVAWFAVSAAVWWRCG